MNEEPTKAVLPPPLPHLTGGPPPRLLTNRPFLWFVLAEGLSGVALWSYFLAVVGDATFRFDASPGQLGVLLASFSVVFIPAAPAFGTLADRWSPLRMTQLATAGLGGAALLAAWAPSIHLLYASMALGGLLEGVTWPSKGAIVPRLVSRDRLVPANGMLGAAREASMAIGPAMAGGAAALWGGRAPYVVAFVGLGVAALFYLLVPDRRPEAQGGGSFFGDLVAGIAGAVRVPVLRILFALGAGVMLALGVVQTLEPLFVRQVLGRGQDALGFLWAMAGVGAFLASLALMRLARGAGAEMLIVAIGVTVGGVGFVLYVGTGSYAVAIPGVVLLGAGYALFFASAQALIQRISDAPGKVSSVFIVIGEVGPLLAALVIGAVGQLDVRLWLVSSAVAFLAIGLVGLVAARRPALMREQAPASVR